MNLARVEYYLSDFLSIIETRKRHNNRVVTDVINLEKAALQDYGDLYFPENLYIIGTVNMDETTFPFSKKVLDRANTIEFSYVNLVPKLDSIGEEVDPIPQENDFLKTKYLVLKTDILEEQHDFVKTICNELQSINLILQEANAHVGYRVRDEIVFYMLNNDEAKLLEYEEALDNEIMQKLLPRIQGSSSAIKKVLSGLFAKCAGDYSGFAGTAAYEQMDSYLDSKPAKYPNSANYNHTRPHERQFIEECSDEMLEIHLRLIKEWYWRNPQELITRYSQEELIEILEVTDDNEFEKILRHATTLPVNNKIKNVLEHFMEDDERYVAGNA